MNKLIEDLDSIPEIFTEGYRGVLLLKRNKDGEEGNAQRNAIKRITRNSKEWKETIQELYELQQTSYQGHRIYSSVNPRNITKAIQEFKRRQLDNDYGNLYEHESFYWDILNRFFSCLMNPSARDQNHFLIDCDSQEEYANAELQLRNTGLILFQYATKNGWHIITRPFISNDYGNMQIKKDDLIYIG